MKSNLNSMLRAAFCYIFSCNRAAIVPKGPCNEMRLYSEQRRTNVGPITHVAV